MGALYRLCARSIEFKIYGKVLLRYPTIQFGWGRSNGQGQLEKLSVGISRVDINSREPLEISLQPIKIPAITKSGVGGTSWGRNCFRIRFDITPVGFLGAAIMATRDFFDLIGITGT
jgi:hypothetical protein